MDYRTLPKALLHDHLDGGLRVSTLLDLAEGSGYQGLPSTSPEELADWFFQGSSGSLETYLAAFDHTTAVMQDATAIERIAYETVVDLAADGVVYAESRYCPSLSTRGGLDIAEVVEATLAGLRRGEEDTGTVAGFIVTALRNGTDSLRLAELAVAMAQEGVVGFDLAGPEDGYPPDEHLEAFQLCHEAGLQVTIHAGEAFGTESMRRARELCGAQRIGHGIRIADDAAWIGDEAAEPSAFALAVRADALPLEVALSSNIHTGAYPDFESHPLGQLHRAGFAVTLNTDNRLMSRTNLSREFELAAEHHGFELADFLKVTETALYAGFGDPTQRRRLLEEVVRPAYAELD